MIGALDFRRAMHLMNRMIFGDQRQLDDVRE